MQCDHMGNIFKCIMLMNGEPHVILALLVNLKKGLMARRLIGSTSKISSIVPIQDLVINGAMVLQHHSIRRLLVLLN
jgi:hypothetical protein